MTTAQAIGTLLGSVDLPGDLLSQSFIADRVSHWRFMRADVEIMVNVNSNKFLYGTFMTVIVPDAAITDTTVLSSAPVADYSADSHCLTHVNEPEGVTFVVPWLYPRPALDLYQPMLPYNGRVLFYVTAPLTAVSTAAALATVDITVYARFINVVLDGPTDDLPSARSRFGAIPRPAAAGAGAPRAAAGAGKSYPQMRKHGASAVSRSSVTHEQRAKSASGALTAVAGTVIDTALSLVPTPISDIAGGIASLFGFDYPRSITADTRTVSRLAPTLPYGEGLDFSTRLSRTVTAEPTGFTGISPADDMTVQSLASVPSLLVQFSQAESAGPTTVLAYWPVNPHHCYYETDAITCLPTTLAGATLPFAFWRGSLVYNFFISCSTSHSTRIRVSFYPMDQGEAGPIATKSNCLSTVYDINGPMAISFTAPFIHDRPMALESIGTIYVSVENSFAPIGDVVTAPIYYSVYVHAADDLQVAELSGRQFVSAADVVPAPEDVPHVWPAAFAKGSAEGAAGSVSTPITTGQVFYSDFYTSISKVLHAPTVWAVAPALSSADIMLAFEPKITKRFVSTPIVGLGPCLARLPTNSAGRFGPGGQVLPLTTIVGVPNLLPVSASLNFLPTLHDHFACFYRYQRGSWRIKVLTAPASTPGSGDCLALTATPASLQAVGTFTTGSFGAYPVLAQGSTWAGSDLPVAVEGTDSLRVAEVEVPYRSACLYNTTGPIPMPSVTTGWPSVLSSSRFYTEDTMTSMCLFPLTASSRYSAIFRSAGDDYRLMGARCCPGGARVIQRRSTSAISGDTAYQMNLAQVWAGVYEW